MTNDKDKSFACPHCDTFLYGNKDTKVPIYGTICSDTKCLSEALITAVEALEKIHNNKEQDATLAWIDITVEAAEALHTIRNG